MTAEFFVVDYVTGEILKGFTTEDKLNNWWDMNVRCTADGQYLDSNDRQVTTFEL